MTVTAARPRADIGSRGALAELATWTAASEAPCRLDAYGSGIDRFTASAPLPHDRRAQAPQLDEIVDGADQLKLALRSDQAAQRKAPEATALDLADRGLDRDLPLGVDRATTFRAQSSPHPVSRAQVLGNAPARRAGRRRPMAITLDGNVGLDGPAVALLQGLHVDLGEVRSEEHTSELQSQSNLVCRL